MKKHFLILIALMLTVMAFADEYFIGDGTASHGMMPFDLFGAYGWCKSIYTKNELNAEGFIGGGEIISIGYHLGLNPNGFTMKNQVIYARHTTASTCDNTYPDPLNNGFQLLYQDDIYFSRVGWNEIILTYSFTWNGNDNIELLYENRSGETNWPTKSFSCTVFGDYMAAYANSSTFPSGVSGTLEKNRLNLMLVTASAGPPPSATLVSPVDEFTWVSNTATLNWESVSGATGYKVYWGTIYPPDIEEDVGDQTTFDPGTLDPVTPYYWQVVPYNDDYEAEDCPVWSFTTAPEGLVSIGAAGKNKSLPIFPDEECSYGQSIYLQSEIKRTDLSIKKIWYYWNGGNTLNNSNEWVVYMAHTNKTTFANRSDWVIFSSSDKVFDGTLNIPATPGWIEIELDTPFEYNNTDNLVIGVDENKPGNNIQGFFFCTDTTGYNRSLLHKTSNPVWNCDPENPRDAIDIIPARPNIVFGPDLPEGADPVAIPDADEGNTIAMITGDANFIDGSEQEPTQSPNPAFESEFCLYLDLLGAGPWEISINTTYEWIWVVGVGAFEGPGVVTFTVPAGGKGQAQEMQGGSGGNPTLPLELSSFTATIQAQNYVQLTWVTQTETEVLGYYIYRSTDNDLVSAERICDLIPGTNTSQTQSYVYLDKELYEDGLYYYWLENVDFNGSNQYHGPISIQYSASTTSDIPEAPPLTRIRSVYPNPFNPNTRISYELAKDADVIVNIYNTRGQLVKNIPVGLKAMGNHHVDWDGKSDRGDDCASGVYYIKMHTGGKVYSTKAVMIK